jgi:hypothetical protein
LNRPELPQDLEVYIESIDEQGRATYVSGYFEFKNARMKFDAIAMEGYGGPNIAATLSDETLAILRQMGLGDDEISELITALQRKIMEGEAHMELHQDDAANVRDEIDKTRD